RQGRVEGRFAGLGDGGQLQAAGEVDDGSDQGDLAVVAVVGGHQRPVDLEDVDGQVAEVRQRRVTGAEVVDGDADAIGAQRFQMSECLSGLCAGPDEDAFGDFEGE